MLEIPEALTIASQLEQTVLGRTIVSAVAAKSPHGFAWYTGDPALYGELLNNKKITGTASYGGRPEIEAEEMRIAFGDGVNVRYLDSDTKRPEKHQLLLELDSGDAICCTIQMYGGMWAFKEGTNQGFYYNIAKEKPSPLSDEFNADYFISLLGDETKKMSAKAFLATGQRIPGLGNGVLQEILWTAKIHPKKKISALSASELELLYEKVKSVLVEMTEKGGRDTERDLFRNPGGYVTALNRKKVGTSCPVCGETIQRAAYMGGNIYFCIGCQGDGR